MFAGQDPSHCVRCNSSAFSGHCMHWSYALGTILMFLLKDNLTGGMTGR